MAADKNSVPINNMQISGMNSLARFDGLARPVRGRRTIGNRLVR